MDKNINTFVMRLKEWFSWHFPELARIVTDYVTYAHIVDLVGMRTTVKNIPLEKLGAVAGSEEIAQQIKDSKIEILIQSQTGGGSGQEWLRKVDAKFVK
jgi:RNA processing factor Prp31